jgi:nicotinate-nucleotide adenylyltransferase
MTPPEGEPPVIDSGRNLASESAAATTAECRDVLPGGPYATPGQRIGLLGGSFDPPHAGHVHISTWALRAFGLDRVWWLVSPGNPLKPDAPADLARRLAAARAVMRHPRISVTDLEARLGTRYTAATLAALGARCPGARFVWLMGADNLASFHHWDRWPEIMAAVPVGVLARPGQQLRAGLSPAARRFARWRLPASQAKALPFRQPPAWTLVTGRMVQLSSTTLRANGAWRR